MYDAKSGRFAGRDPSGFQRFHNFYEIADLAQAMDPSGMFIAYPFSNCTKVRHGFSLGGAGEDGKLAGSNGNPKPGLGKLGRLLAQFGAKLDFGMRGYCDWHSCTEECECGEEDWFRRECNGQFFMAIIASYPPTPGVYFGIQGSVRIGGQLFTEQGGCSNDELYGGCWTLTGSIEFKICAGKQGVLEGCISGRMTCNSGYCASTTKDPHARGTCKFSVNLSGCLGGFWCSVYRVGEGDDIVVS
jgi:hypothetical protein